MPINTGGPGDNAGQRFEDIIDLLYWTDDSDGDDKEDDKEEEEG